MTPVAVARKSLFVILAIVALAGLWTLVAPFAAGRADDYVACPTPLDAMRDPRDVTSSGSPNELDYFEREACVPGARTRVSIGSMLLVAAGVGSLMTIWLLEENPMDHVREPPRRKAPPIDH